jgi:hypothetical protein
MHAMIVSGRVGLAVLTIAGGVWAGAVGLAGLWVLLSATARWPAHIGPLVLVGVTFLAMSQFIFSYFVADRLFPGMGRRIGWWVEAGAIGVFVPGFLVAVAGLILGVWP